MGRDSGGDTEPDPMVPSHFRSGFFSGFTAGAAYQRDHGTPNWCTTLYEINSWLRKNPKDEAKLREDYFNERKAGDDPVEQLLAKSQEENRELREERYSLRNKIRELEHKLKETGRVARYAGEKLKPLADDLMSTLADVAHRARCIELSEEATGGS